MVDVFGLPFVQRAVLEVLVLAVAGGLIGTWIVLRGLAFYAHAVGTAAFPGLVLADGLGFAAHLGAAGSAALVAAGVGLLSRRDGERHDTATALVLVAALALGVVLASDVFESGASVETLLFGSLLVVDGGDIAWAAAAGAAVLLATVVLGPRWTLEGFDTPAARAMGLRSGVPDAVLLALVALVAVAALSAIGALLATALIVVPAATTRLVCSRLRTWQAATIGLAAAEGVAGVWLSVQTDAPPGGTVAVLSGAVFAAVAAGHAVLGRSRRRRAPVAAGALLALALLGAGCGAEAADDAGGRLQVVATTTQAGDIVRAIAGDAAVVTQVLQPNSDPHDYEPRPSDVVRTAEAAVVFRSGENLDAWMDEVVEQSGGDPRVVDLGASARHTLPGEEEGDDPHWWHDPRNVAAAVPVIRDALSAADPAARATYAAGAHAYLARVSALDAGIAACLGEVPAAQRKLVTDHDAFGLFARRYGIEVIGAVIPSQTTQAQASARDTARLTALIRREQVRAVFPETSVNARLARAIARATGATARYVLYGDTLGPAGSSGATYLTMERANADAMVRGFTGGARGCAISGI